MGGEKEGKQYIRYSKQCGHGCFEEFLLISVASDPCSGEGKYSSVLPIPSALFPQSGHLG